MDMIPVSSSNLVAVGYNPSVQELTVQFHNGVYTYCGVPQFEYENLLNDTSKGEYLLQISNDILLDQDISLY